MCELSDDADWKQKERSKLRARGLIVVEVRARRRPPHTPICFLSLSICTR